MRAITAKAIKELEAEVRLLREIAETAEKFRDKIHQEGDCTAGHKEGQPLWCEELSLALARYRAGGGADESSFG